MKRLAEIISKIFNPLFEIPLLLSLSVFYAYLNGLAWKFLVMLLFVDAVLPFVFFYYLYRRHEVSDFDISVRSQRIPVYGFTMLTHLAGVGVTYLLGKIPEAQILFIFWMLGMAFFGVTTFWKISVHAGVNTALATFMVIYGGVQWAWLYLVILPVGWSRVILKKHSLGEFTSGVLLAFVGMILGFSMFGIL